MAEQSITAEVLSASIGGAFSAAALFPLEIIKTKVQSSQCEETNTDKKQTDHSENDSSSSIRTSSPTLSLVKSMYEKGGISAFYRGVETSAIQSSVEKALYFFSYTALKQMYALLSSERIGPVSNLALGCVAEWTHLPITLPIDCLTTKICTNTDPNQNAYALLCSLLSDKGLKGMYKGLSAYWVLCFKPAIQYTIFEQVKRIRLAGKKGKRKQLSAFEAFLLGMFARCIATVVVFPYIRAKVMMQTSASHADHDDATGHDKKTNTIPDMLQNIIREEGFKALFKGIGPELTRGVLSTALMMMVKEKIGVVVQNIVD